MNATSLSKAPDQRASEPSMEEILASIRRIIADDRMLPLTQRNAPVSAEARTERNDSAARENSPSPSEKRRAESLAERAPAPESPALRVLPGGLPESPASSTFFQDERGRSDEETAEDSSFLEELASEETVAQQAEPELDAESEHEAEPLISAQTDASVASSFQSLAATVFLQNTGVVEQSLRELLRPLLKQWLDENLPSLVERLVRAEIERVARGGRG
jgi:uncharacterized protein